MPNTILTPTAVTREALRILHQKLNFIGTINRQYDNSFAKTGAKIGDSLKIRLPNQYTVRTGRAINLQSTAEQSVTLQVATQKGVDVEFTSSELTLSLDDFAKRILDPAMSVLAAHIEADAMSMYKDVFNEVSDVGASASTALVLAVQKKLTDALAPMSDRSFNMSTQNNVDLVEALKAVFNDQSKVAKQYRDGIIANNFLGFQDVYQNTLWPRHATGSDASGYLVNEPGTIAEGASGVAVDTGTGTFKKGDVIFFQNVFRVHPETKASTGKLQQFVVTADAGASATSLSISPALYATGAKQNVNAMPADNAAVWKREYDESTAISASAAYEVCLGYHQDAFAIAFADLQMPKGIDFAAREVMDGISMRIVRAFDINNDNFPCRIDVLYGYKTVRPELACRLGLH